MKLFTRTNNQVVKQTIRLYLEQAKLEKRQVVLFSLCIPVGYLLYTVLVPFFISLITQELIVTPKSLEGPLWLLGAMLVASIATIVINHFGFIGLFNHEERVTTRLTEKAMSGLLRHSHNFFSNQKVGSLAGDVNTFGHSYLEILDTLFLQGSSIAVNIVASLIIVGVIAPIMLLPLGAVTAFVVLHSLHSLTERAPYRNKRKELQSKLFGSVADVLGNHMLVRLFGKQHTEVRRIVDERRAIEDVAQIEIDLLQKNAEVRQGVLFAFQILTIGLCVVLFHRSLLTISALIFIITYLGRITSSMFNITSIIRTIEQAFLNAAKVTEILAITPEVRDDERATTLDISRGTIDFDVVSFSYEEDKSHRVFDQLDLHIPDGQRVGLVGRSGGGKTTLTNLLLRYMDIKAGSIRIDDQDISHVTQDSLRNVISYVPQDPFLFHRTVRENIAYGTTGSTEASQIGALKQAGAYEFVMDLPHGLDTVVGERGVKLSGGQRQRIAIARAILKDAPILVLDEATSALDSESEKLIQDAFEKLMKGRTSIVIAHRLSTIAKLDRIVVLDHGKIVEDGTHKELIERGGIYASLWKHQSGGFIEE